jgi:RecA/RadA recombinase
MVVGEELGMITRSGASSWPAVTESSSEDNLHTTFTQQPVTSEQNLENLDSFPSSLQSDLVVIIIVLILIFVLPSFIYTNTFISTGIS